MTPPRRDVILTLIGCAIVVAAICAVRWFGPGDLYEKDQPKTIAYTADIVLHGRYALPRDVIYQPATKPPFYNWLGAAAVGVSGSWSEWILKFPSVVGTALTAICVAIASRRVLKGEPPAVATITAALAVAVFFTFGSDVRHGSVIRLSHLARPDMLQCGLITAAWLCAWIAVDRTTRRASLGPALFFWLCVAFAILTKGPAALMTIGFVLLYPLFARSPEAGEPVAASSAFRSLARLHWELGVPLVLLLGGTWFYFAYQQDPQHVRQVMLGAEIGARLTEESPEGFRKPVYYAVMWFVTKAMPWGGLALAAIAYFVAMRSLRHRLSFGIAAPWPTAAIVWLFVILIGLSLPAGKRMDYALPAYAPASLLVAVMAVDLARRLRVPLWLPIGAPVLLAGVLAYSHLTKFHEAKSHYTDNAVRFTREVRDRVATSDRLLVLVRGKHPLPTLLGLHPGSYLTPADFAGPVHVVMPEQADLKPILLSEPLPIGFDDIQNRETARLGLYRFGRGHNEVSRLIELQKQIGTWTTTENPYRAPGTVYRDE